MLHTDMERYRRPVLFAVGIAALVVVLLLLLWRVADIFLLALAGLLIAVLLLTVANFLSRGTPLKGKWSLPVTLLLLIALLVGAGWWIGPRLASQFDELTQSISQPIQRLEETLAQYRWGDQLLRQVPLLEQPTQSEQAGAALNQGEQDRPPNRLSLPVGRVLSGLTGIVSTLLDILANIVFVVFIGIFLAATPRLYQDGIVRLFPLDRREHTREVLNELFETLQGWLLGQFIAMLIVGVLTALGLWLLGMPLVFTLAFIAFLLEFVPFIGPFLAAVPAVLVALSQSPAQALWVVLLYLVIQQLEGNVIYPLVQKKTVDLPPALTLLAIFVMSALFGFIGLLVAAPFVAVILVLVKRVYVKDALGEPSPGDARQRAT